MFGFELNDVDPHDAIPRRVAKVHIRENLHSLGPILNQRVEEVFMRLQNETSTKNGLFLSLFLRHDLWRRADVS